MALPSALPRRLPRARAAPAARDRVRRPISPAPRCVCRSSGWVAKMSVKSVRGLSMHISITAELARGSSPRPSILRSAMIMASGFLVSSTEPASARYSRWRDKAKRITIDSIQETTIRPMAMRMAMPAPPFLSLLPPRRAAPAEARALEHQAEDHLAEERDDAGDHHGDHQHAHVAVADMGQLVAEHGFHFGIGERLLQPAGHRDGILLLVHPGGEGVERDVVDDLQLRRRDAARDAEVFQEVIKPRLFRAGDFLPAGHGIDHRLVEFIGDRRSRGSCRRWPRAKRG